MNRLLHSLAAPGIAAMIAGVGPNSASASEKSTVGFAQIGKAGDTTILVEQETTSKKRINLMLKGYDPVAYFKQGKAVKGKASIRSPYNGVTYFFASKANKADFDKSPAKFEPQYGGFCANTMVKGKLSESDPNIFHIYRGKLYVHSSPAAGQEFRSNPDANITKADGNWLVIGPATYNSETRGFDSPWPFGPASSGQ